MGASLVGITLSMLGTDCIFPRLPGYAPQGVVIDFGSAAPGPRAELFFRFLIANRTPINDEWSMEADSDPAGRCFTLYGSLVSAKFHVRELGQHRLEVLGYYKRQPNGTNRFTPVVDILVRTTTPLRADQLPQVTPAKPRQPPR